MTEVQAAAIEANAAVSTAHGTWWLVIVTVVLAAVSIGAVLFSAWDQRNVRKDDRLRVDRGALKAVLAAFAFIHEIHDARTANPSTAEADLWPVSAKLNAHRRVLELYLSGPPNDHELPYLVTDALQRIYEVRDAIVGLLPKEHGPTWIAASTGIIQRAVERMCDAEAKAAVALARIGD